METSKSQELNQVITAAISASGETIKNSYVNAQVNKEIERRVDLLTKLVEALSVAKKALNKYRPDSVVYGKDGQVQSEGFTEKTFKERAKAIEKVNKGEKALDAALSNDYSNTENMIKELAAGNQKDDEKSA